jgi:vacuolar-type H+-ATPase subunit C/Vma6
MKPRWEDVNARCRGLGSTLLGRAEWDRLEAATEWRAIPRVLQPWLRSAGVPATPRDLDAALVQHHASVLDVVERWLGPRRRFLRVVWEGEERCALRAVLRGAAEGAAADRRLDGIVPTRGLPVRLLRRLAEARSPADAIAALGRAGHPFAPALARARIGPGPAGLLELDLALSRAWAERAVEGVRGGGLRLVQWVREAIDAENALALAVSAEWVADLPPEDAWLPGGGRIDRQRFVAIARAEPGTDPLDLLRAHFRRGAIREALDEATEVPALARQILRRRTEAARAAARRDPLGPWPTCWFLLRTRLELTDLRHAAWRLAFRQDGPTAARGAAA